MGKKPTPEECTCTFCGKVNTFALNVCKGCNKSRYCNIDCQRNHWKAGHKNQCKEIAKKEQEIKEAIEALQTTKEEKMMNAAKRLISSPEAEEAEKKVVVDDEVVDETGVDPHQLKILLEYASPVRKSLAVKALRAKNNDILDAILAITPGLNNEVVIS